MTKKKTNLAHEKHKIAGDIPNGSENIFFFSVQFFIKTLNTIVPLVLY